MTTLAAFRVAPQMEFKAAEEFRQHNIRAYVPRDPAAKRKSPVARGYVFAASAYKPAFAKHVKGKIGNLPARQLASLYLRRERKAESLCPFKPGDQVIIRKGHAADLPATVKEVRGRTCIVTYAMLGKVHQQAIPYAALHPG